MFFIYPEIDSHLLYGITYTETKVGCVYPMIVGWPSRRRTRLYKIVELDKIFKRCIKTFNRNTKKTRKNVKLNEM